jgi:spermidine/putrescine transport system substrate-binding protein
MKKLLIRSVIILFWISLISLGLYWPKWKLLHIEKNSITVFAWGDILSPAAISAFEKETGIKVHLNFYSSNEELIVKLKATEGVGYDLIIPSDYAVKRLSDTDLLKTIDKQKLPFWEHLNPRLVGQSFDPQNQYSIPFEWEVFCIGYDKDYFVTRPLDPSWRMIFNPPSYKVGMINDPVEAVQFAAFDLFGDTRRLNPSQTDRVRKLLMNQKQHVEAYAESRADYFLATRSCPIVLSSSSYLLRTMKNFPFVGAIVPQEGSFLTIENFAIPKATEKEALVYQFINFLYRPEIMALHYNTFGFFPAAMNALPLLELDPLASQLLFAPDKDFRKLHFIKGLIPEQQLRELWIEVKSH